MKRYVCIHGHFYQPPRENPWLEAIEIQDSAYPYHDWNERITAECYAPNALSRILDPQLRIAKILNNYARISFDVGPTLLSWMEDKTPGVYSAIIEADRISRKTFSGHGSAQAQIYNHMIMPLASRRQKSTQAWWAVRDFEHRFGRLPEGMWLPETAVDVETLEILADLDIKFTILAPHQVKSWRRTGDREWVNASDRPIDTRMPYLAPLPSGRSIALFFYDAQISRSVAFERLLDSGDNFAGRLLGAFDQHSARAQLVNIATDGETYGHHHRYGEMALAYAIRQIDASDYASMTNYGEYLERFPPTHEVEIRPNTAWSCSHGVERWRSNCGCSVSHVPGWNQQWRAPMRASLDWLESEISSRFEECAKEYLRDPWKAQDDYVAVVLDRSTQSLELFLDRHALRPLHHDERVLVLRLLEMQRYSMLMFTSCGWFFDDISGIEAVQNLLYAARAAQLAKGTFGIDLEEGLLARLQHACSNIPEQLNGQQIYETRIRPAVTDLRKVAAHYAISSLFEHYAEATQLYCYTVYSGSTETLRAGRARMVAGRLDITSNTTLESGSFSFCAVHFGDHNLTGGVREFRSTEEFQSLVKEMEEAFNSADLLRVVRLFDRHFAGNLYSLKQLFHDEQRHIVDLMLKRTLEDVGTAYREIYEPNVPLMRFLEDLRVPLPKAFDLAAQFVLNSGLERALDKEPLDLAGISSLLQQAKIRRTTLDSQQLGFRLRKVIKQRSRRLRTKPANLGILASLENLVKLVHMLPFQVVLWDLENVLYEVIQTRYPVMKKRAERGDQIAQSWLTAIENLAQKVRVRI
jgi:alpha-amylase/alpha-mannosidase (GH57 family)